MFGGRRDKCGLPWIDVAPADPILLRTDCAAIPSPVRIRKESPVHRKDSFHRYGIVASAHSISHRVYIGEDLTSGRIAHLEAFDLRRGNGFCAEQEPSKRLRVCESNGFMIEPGDRARCIRNIRSNVALE